MTSVTLRTNYISTEVASHVIIPNLLESVRKIEYSYKQSSVITFVVTDKNNISLQIEGVFVLSNRFNHSLMRRSYVSFPKTHSHQ